MESTYKISFLVPTLGERKQELERLLQSFMRQTYRVFEVVLVTQDNFEQIDEICDYYDKRIDIKIIKSSEKGLSKSRNRGIPFCTGDLIVLSDDDCWYPEDAAENIVKSFIDNDIDVLLTQIYDFDNSRKYKDYDNEQNTINSMFQLMSKSSIEIAYKRDYKTNHHFDELFGLGSHFVCGEEVDFLLNLYRSNSKILYRPIVTVYHEKKYSGSTRKQVVAKGAIYSKNFNCIIGILICVKDLIFRKENNFKAFFEGYNEYKVFKRNN